MLTSAALKKRFAQAMAEANPKVPQARIAEACEVSAQAVTAWKQTGQIDPKHFPALSQLFGRPLEFWYGTAPSSTLREPAAISYLPSQPAGRPDLTVRFARAAADRVADQVGFERGSDQWLVVYTEIQREFQKMLESEVPANRLDLAGKLSPNQPEENDDADRGKDAGNGQHAGGADRKPARKGAARPRGRK